ncbi:MAG: hypothetical protein M3Q49_10705 [Actinomycetota bacterium]|nr:hypothetical protein [Actinomycetota bacterium]MDP9486231.1 hypothetical protein [Actinomycetota bacterium]PLS84375.1 MAG: hypothetical protein CYG60_18250 [Actinomycetota bacterium]
MGRLHERLRRLEVPTEAQYQAALERGVARVLRTCGAPLSGTEEALLEGYGDVEFGWDCDLTDRYRASLTEAKRKKEQHETLSRVFAELEWRGVERPWFVDEGEEEH